MTGMMGGGPPKKDDLPVGPLALAVSDLVTTVFIPRTLEMYTVTNQELEALASGPQSVHIGFLGITIGSLLIVLVALVTVPMDATLRGLFVIGLVLSAIGTAYFGIRAALDLRAARSQLTRIRTNRRLG
jgi:hypothetical protein